MKNDMNKVILAITITTAICAYFFIGKIVMMILSWIAIAALIISGAYLMFWGGVLSFLMTPFGAAIALWYLFKNKD